ncbi:hypothetical protein J4Q44_G00027560 [Coregonus suidteri]|uniref:Uncharacterized protein n=1 Tax=Coregonus suidteri TaxID=861788 RepID=A0AAN8R6L6_9TELE
MEAVRREVERIDYYGGVVLLHSLSRGTGSVSVAPHQSGESPLQHYNTLLSLASLQRSADGVLTRAQALQRALMSTSSSFSGVPPAAGSLSHITSCMAGLLLPVHSLTTASGLSLGMEPWELMRCEVFTCSQPPLHHAGLFQYSSRAVLAVARGNKDGSFLMSNALQKLKKGWETPLPLASSLLGHVVQRAGEMLQARAYLHWYQHYGVEEQDFQQALDTCSAAMQEYDTQVTSC